MVEETRISKPGPDLRGMVESATYTVVISRAFEPEELPAAIAAAQAKAKPAYWLGLRFVLEDWPRARMDAATGESFYAWGLLRGDKLDNARVAGTSPRQAEDRLQAFKPWPGEVVEAVWLDPYSLSGLVGLSRIGGHVHFLGFADGDSRWRLTPVKGQGRRYRATEVVYRDGKRFKADGTGTDSLAVELKSDGALEVFGGRYVPEQTPWIRALPTALKPPGTSPR